MCFSGKTRTSRRKKTAVAAAAEAAAAEAVAAAHYVGPRPTIDGLP